MKVPAPGIQKGYPEDARLVPLPSVEDLDLGGASLMETLLNRRSRRRFNDEYLSLGELSFMFWASQGVQKVIRRGTATLRPAASGGARHPFETYLLVFRAEGLDPGVYRYVPIEHKMLLVDGSSDLRERLVEACMKHGFVGDSAAVFAWRCIPYRTEWSYDKVSHKLIAVDTGHVCQNLYLACESEGVGCCAVVAYHQDLMDMLLGVDGVEEFTVYMAVTGRY